MSEKNFDYDKWENDMRKLIVIASVFIFSSAFVFTYFAGQVSQKASERTQKQQQY